MIRLVFGSLAGFLVACSGADDDRGIGGESYGELAAAITLPDDPLFPAQWGLRNVGQSVPWTTPEEETFLVAGTPGVDINLPLAWDITQGSSDILVGIAELTDVDVAHEDLRDNVFRNRDEIANDGIDNDGNGCVDDVHGCDFIDRDGIENPFSDHATHVAGIVGGRFQNRKGIAGVAPKIKIVPLTASARDGTLIEAIAYARTLGIRVINVSQGGLDWFEPTIRDAIANSGILFVCSAGNRGTPRYNFPSSYDLPNVLAVANVDNTGELSIHSSYSDFHVDIGAPGRSILSSVPGNEYAYLDGTSQAAPHVAGVAALLLKRFPNLTAAAIVDRLMRTGMRMTSLGGLVKSGAMLDAEAALRDVAPIGLSASSIPGRITLSWNAQAGATRYEVERDGVIVGNGGSTTHVHAGLALDSAHIYRVRAIRGTSVGAFSHRLLTRARRMPTTRFVSLASAHPYPNDFEQTYVITQQNATRLRVHFSRVQTAAGDELTYSRSFTDGADQIDERFSGNYPIGFWTHWVNDNRFEFEFSSDSIGNAFGFAVDRIEYF